MSDQINARVPVGVAIDFTLDILSRVIRCRCNYIPVKEQSDLVCGKCHLEQHTKERLADLKTHNQIQ